ncbi:hypothetical protein IAT38_006774 [Cryptococcus sp. DSM 104549]
MVEMLDRVLKRREELGIDMSGRPIGKGDDNLQREGEDNPKPDKKGKGKGKEREVEEEMEVDRGPEMAESSSSPGARRAEAMRMVELRKALQQLEEDGQQEGL